MGWSDILSWLQSLPGAVGVPAFVAARASAIVVPPLQGWPLDALAQQMWGWKVALLWAEIGICTGALVAYELGRLAKQKWLNESALLARIAHFEQAFEGRRWLLWLAIRIVSNPLFDPLSYLAGALGVPRPLYAVTTILGTLPSMALFMWGLERTAGEDWRLGALFVAGFLLLGGVIAQRFLRRTGNSSTKG